MYKCTAATHSRAPMVGNGASTKAKRKEKLFLEEEVTCCIDQSQLTIVSCTIVNGKRIKIV